MLPVASGNERFLVARKEEAPDTMTSVDDIDQFAPEPSWLAAIRAKSKTRNTDSLYMAEINRIVAEVRQSVK